MNRSIHRKIEDICLAKRNKESSYKKHGWVEPGFEVYFQVSIMIVKKAARLATALQ
jgi:hypothetical protein